MLKKIKHFVTAGCSFTAGEDTWPNFLLHNIFNTNYPEHFVNLAIPGGGNQQIFDNLVFLLESKKYMSDFDTLIGINLTEMDRIDTMCSIQHPNKNQYFGWGDMDFNFNWINENGFTVKKPPFNGKLQYNIGYEQVVILNCLSIVKGLSYLENNNFDYFFMTITDDVINESPSWFADFLFARKNKWITFENDQSMFSYSKNNNLLSQDKFHPSIEGQKEIADIILQSKIFNDYLRKHSS